MQPPMNNTDYHAHPAISKSHLDQVAKSPLHYWARYLDPNRVVPEPTPSNGHRLSRAYACARTGSMGCPVRQRT
jgi:hypothetical protein